MARALALAAGRPDLDAVALAQRTGRGLRSALGVHGFAQGGFLVEGGKRTELGIAPLLARLVFPETWRIVVAIPPVTPGRHGDSEREAFRDLLAQHVRADHDATLCRLVLLGMLPALIEQDLDAFGEALHDFNARVGEMFAPVQGGTYAGPRVTELVAFLRAQGIRGVAQSSWGPAVAAVAADAGQAEHLVRLVRRQFALDTEVFVTRACNEGATVNVCT